MMRELRLHDWDPQTSYCVKCGASAKDVVEHGHECAEGVTAISHIVSRRRMQVLLGKVAE